MKITRDLVEVGVYPLGLDYVKLFAVIGSANGSVEMLPDDKGLTQITVGVGVPWGEAIAILLHETYELTLINMNTRYKKKPSFSGESSDYVFFLSHNELGEAHDRIGEFLALALPDFEDAYKEIKKRELAKKKKKKKK